MGVEVYIKARDMYEYGSPRWVMFNEMKNQTLEYEKPESMKEIILYFLEDDLKNIPDGFSRTEELPDIPMHFHKRSHLEYNPKARHPIPYCIVKCSGSYYITFRKTASGEGRLVGKIGLLGGHVNVEDKIEDDSLTQTICNALMREIKEEAGIVISNIKDLTLKGFIKGNDGVDKDHLGVIYEIELFDKNIEILEEKVLNGSWLLKEELEKNYDRMESWAKIVYDNLIK